MVQDRWGDPVDPEKVALAIEANPNAKVLAFVHAEDLYGVRSDAEQLCRPQKAAGMLTIVDAVTSLAGIDLQVDAWGAKCRLLGYAEMPACRVLRRSLLVPMRSMRSRIAQAHKSGWFLDMDI